MKGIEVLIIMVLSSFLVLFLFPYFLDIVSSFLHIPLCFLDTMSIGFFVNYFGWPLFL